MFTAPPVQAFRLSAYSLECIGFPGARTTAVLTGNIETLTRIITFRASCDNGVSTSVFPELTDADGPINSIQAHIIAETAPRNGGIGTRVKTPCTFTSQNSFLAGTCIANPSEKTPPGRVNFSISVAP